MTARRPRTRPERWTAPIGGVRSARIPERDSGRRVESSDRTRPRDGDAVANMYEIATGLDVS